MAGWAVGALIAALPLLQLIPVPPALWQALPGRANETAALALVGAGGRWMPWSISPALTFASLLSLLPPLAALAFAACGGRQRRILMTAAIAVGGIASVLLGALQLADGDGRTWRFYVDNQGFLNGFQANRNAEADVLLIAALAAAAAVRLYPARRSALASALGAGLCLVLLLGSVMTGSRTGIALLALTAAVAALILLPRLQQRRWRAALAAATIGLLPLVLLAIALSLHNQALSAVAGRFTLERDMRAELWRDAWSAIRGYWPCGSGVGTFARAYLPFERLEVVDPTQPVRVHNDYLEFVMEGGAAALLVMLSGVAVLVREIARALRRVNRENTPQLLFALGTLAIVGVHSFVDYPLRSMALTILTATAVGIIMGLASGPGGKAQGGLTKACQDVIRASPGQEPLRWLSPASRSSQSALARIQQRLRPRASRPMR